MRRNLAPLISFLSLLILTVIQAYIIFSYYEVKSRNFDMAYSKAILSTIEKAGSDFSAALSSLKQQRIRNDDQKFTETCNMLEKQNKFLSRMIDDVIDISLLDRNTINYIKKPIPLKELMNEIVASFIQNNEAVGKNVKIKEQYSIPEDYTDQLDPVQFTRAINNLLNNAVKYSERNPEIWIRLSADNQLKIEIEDNGIGIKEEQLGYVFNKFYRADHPAKVKGLGLGLYIVKRIIENHNGTIHLESVSGEGTTVIISFPKLT